MWSYCDLNSGKGTQGKPVELREVLRVEGKGGEFVVSEEQIFDIGFFVHGSNW